MKLTNLLDNIIKHVLSMISSVCSWFNGLLIGLLGCACGVLVCYALEIMDSGLNVRYELKKKKK